MLFTIGPPLTIGSSITGPCTKILDVLGYDFSSVGIGVPLDPRARSIATAKYPPITIPGP